MTKRQLLLAVSLATVIQGCSSTSNETSTSSEHITITSAEKELANVIKDLSCDASYQCKVLPLGERSCGGPSRFVIYSTKNNSQERIEQLGTEITSFEKAYNKKDGHVESCRSTIQPQTLCLNQQCEQIH
jgi:lipopolysaccharide export system protein LptA